MPIDKAMLDNWFTYHQPDFEQLGKYQRIRDAGRAFAEVVIENTPPSADQTAAVRHIRDAVATANAAVACDGK